MDLSPEQARGHAVDLRSDIHAAGIVLRELLTGRQMLPANPMSPAAALAAARAPDVRPPSEPVPGIPDGLDAVVLRALAIEREHRYPSADRFRAGLAEILARNYPTCDTDRVGEFMRDIFAQDHKFETLDHASYVREDFSRVRKQGRGQDAISLADSTDFPCRGRGAASESEMADTEERGTLSGARSRPNASTREDAEQRWGTVVAGRYRVEDLQAFDGMGALYRARDTERGVPCALRVLPEIYARETEVMDRFIRDAQAAQELKHPNIAQVFDIGKLDDGSVYAVTELLDGQNLATVIQEEGRISPGRAVHVASQVSRALGTAHESGIIHRDFKPSNIVLVAQEGDLDFVKVVDFGICSHVDNEPSMTSSTQELIVGSPDYMAPEQAAGAEADPASDIYALGSVLFEMLTGRLPFKGRNAIDVLIQKGARDAPRVSDIAPDAPEGLSDVIAACLSRRPEDRPKSMRVLEVELLRALDTKPRPVKSAVAAALAGGGRRDDERSGDLEVDLPLPPPPESASSSSMRAPVIADISNPRMAHTSDVRTLTGSSPTLDRREPSVVIRPPERPTYQDLQPPPQKSSGWIWLVVGGVVVIAAVLLYPQLFGAGGPGEETKKKRTEEVAQVHDDEIPEPEPLPPPPPPTKDPAVIVSRAELALGAGRYTDPPQDNLTEYLQQLSTLDPENEAIIRLRGKAVETLLAKGTQELADKHAHEAADHLRKLLIIAPDNKDAITPFTQAVITESKILRHMQSWSEILPLTEEVARINPKSFDAQMLRGQALGGLSRWADAVEAYKAAVELRKKDKTANAALADAKKNAGVK